jgi:hypothetical protein
MQTDESRSGETHTEVFSQDAIAGEIMTKNRKDGMNSNFFFLFSFGCAAFGMGFVSICAIWKRKKESEVIPEVQLLLFKSRGRKPFFPLKKKRKGRE